jgi:hypothetical protein
LRVLTAWITSGAGESGIFGERKTVTRTPLGVPHEVLHCEADALVTEAGVIEALSNIRRMDVKKSSAMRKPIG